MKKIGIFGGTFNPIHIGHVKMAEAARREFKLNVVYFIPCGIPPHRTGKLYPAKLRYKWVKEAVKDKKYFKVLDIEIKKKRKAYTIDTVKGFRKYSALYFLIGQDEFSKLSSWKSANELAKLVTFLVLPRKGRGKPMCLPKIRDLKWKLVKTKPINISAEKIREKIKNKKSVKKSLPFVKFP